VSYMKGWTLARVLALRWGWKAEMSGAEEAQVTAPVLIGAQYDRDTETCKDWPRRRTIRDHDSQATRRTPCEQVFNGLADIGEQTFDMASWRPWGGALLRPSRLS
jgi:hypothetical protein